MAATLSCHGAKAVRVDAPSTSRVNRRRYVVCEEDEEQEEEEYDEDEDEVELGLSQMADVPQPSQLTPPPARKKGNSHFMSPEYPREQLPKGMAKASSSKMKSKRGRKK